MRLISALGLLSGVAVLGTADSARATLLAQEDFSGYVAGQPLAGQGTATNGFSGAWRPSTSNAFFNPNLDVRATPVVDPAIVSSGQSAGGGFTRIYRELSSTVTATTATTPTYLSFVGGNFFLQQFDIALGSDADAAHVGEFETENASTNPNAPSTSPDFRNEIHTLDVTTNASAGETISTSVFGHSSGSFTDQKPDLYVFKYDPIAKTVSYYEFANGVRPASVADATYSETEAIDPTRYAGGLGYDRIGLFTVDSPESSGISNIRIGTEFSDVAPLTALPEPASLGLLAIASGGLLLRKRRA